MKSIIRKIRLFFESPRKRMVRVFKADNRERNLRLNYDLDNDSVIFDVGGYEGGWASEIYERYGSTIYIFEPVAKFAENIKKRFKDSKKIKVLQTGLSGKNAMVKISLDADGSSTEKGGDKSEMIELIKASDFIKNNNINKIDLMKINIEGGEYCLLEDLIDTGEISKIRNVQVQFHDIAPDSRKKMNEIQDRLSKTHHKTYAYEFVWENWEIN